MGVLLMEIEKDISADDIKNNLDNQKKIDQVDESQNNKIIHLEQDTQNHCLQGYHDIELKLAFYSEFIEIFNEKEEEERKKKLLHILNILRQTQQMTAASQQTNNQPQTLQKTSQLATNRVKEQSQDHTRTNF